MLKIWITGILIVCTVLSAGAEEEKEPVIAVVLSGGGALGFAHVGVLKVLEEEGIRPDMVIGASIGSIIGGLYCVGYSAEEIEGIILDTDWKYTFTDSFNRKELSYEQKKRQAEYNLSFATREENRVEDAGLSHAQHVVELLDRLLAPYAVETDFDSLPIPFRAVGADLLTGEKIIYEEGDLKTVIRASMAVPGVFTPVPYRGQYVIDGGWVDNLPTTVAKEGGADIIIAVSLFSMEEDIDTLSSMTAVLSQSDQIRTIERNQKSLEVSDLVIIPDLSGYGMGSFEEGESLMALGYEAASAKREDIRALAESLGKADPVPDRKVSDDRVKISRITVNTGGDDIEAEKFRDALLEEIGSTPVLSELRDRLYSFYDTGEFTHVWYQMVPMGNGDYELVVDAPLQIQPLELFSTSIDFSSQILNSRITNFTLKTAYQRWLGKEQNTSATFELWLSEFPSVLVSLDYHPMGRDLHLKTKGYLLQNPQYFFLDDELESMYTLDRAGASFSLELPLFRRIEFRLGAYSESLWVDSRLGVSSLNQGSWLRNGARNIVSVDTRDRVITPTRGLNATWIMDEAFDQDGEHVGKSQFAGEGFLPLTKKLIIIPALEYQSLLWGDVNPVELPALGGQIQNYGYYTQELRGENVGLFSCGVRKQIGRLPLGLGDEIYLQLAGSVAATWDRGETREYDFSDLYAGGSLGVVVYFLMGELELNTGMNREGRWSTFLGLSTSTSFFSEFD